MDSIPLNLLGTAVVQELWNKVAFSAKDLIKETEHVVLHKGTFQEFSNQISHLNILFQALHDQRVQTRTDSQLTKATLATLSSQFRRASNIIRDYKSGSKLRLVFKSHHFLKQMKKLSHDIAQTVSSLDLGNLETAIDIKFRVDLIIDGLRSIEFKSAAGTEAIASEIEKSLVENKRSREHTVHLLHRIAEAVGAIVDESMVRNELELLKQEKEEMEAQKKQAEAFHLSQMIQFLYSSEMVTNPHQEDENADEDENEDNDIKEDEEITTYQRVALSSFTCPLSKELMIDPVALYCGHSFEREAIQEHFQREEKRCPTCKQELLSMELTPNVSLRNSIEEWKQRELELKIHSAVSGISSDDQHIINKAFEDLQVLIEIPECRTVVSENGLIPKMVEALKANGTNTKPALKCLRYLSSHSDDNKEAIAEAGAVPCIVKYLCRGTVEPDAVAILSALAQKETLAKQVGNAKYCIPLMVSLIQSSNSDVSGKAQSLLQKLSSDIHFIVKMAEAGHFQPLVTCFKEGGKAYLYITSLLPQPQYFSTYFCHQAHKFYCFLVLGSLEKRASITTSLIGMQLGQNSIKEFEDKRFIRRLVQMLSLRSPTARSACLNFINKLLVFPEMVKAFLSQTNIIPLLVNLISVVSSEEDCKKDATRVLISLIKATPLSEFQTSTHLQELQSQDNISIFLDLATATSDPQQRVQGLALLLVLSHMSETTRDSVRNDKDAVANLYKFVKEDQPEVRTRVLELIYCVGKDNSDGVPLPVSPAKESAINALLTTFTSSPSIKNRSIAAGIISCLPINDVVVDNILCKSVALQAIQEVICGIDRGRMIAPIDTGESSMLLEEALAALLRYTDPSKPELQKQVSELQLYPSLVRILSQGSSTAKERAAMALAHLSESANMIINHAESGSIQANKSVSLLNLTSIFHNVFGCCGVPHEYTNHCPVHGFACSPTNIFCLFKADAVRPLVQTLSDTQSGAAEAALIALETVLTGPSASSQVAAIIADNQGVAAILEVMEKGSLSAKDKALDLFNILLQHMSVNSKQCERSSRILIHLFSEDALKRKAALLLKQMKLLPDQSSYF